VKFGPSKNIMAAAAKRAAKVLKLHAAGEDERTIAQKCSCGIATIRRIIAKDMHSGTKQQADIVSKCCAFTDR
jgi:transposase